MPLGGQVHDALELDQLSRPRAVATLAMSGLEPTNNLRRRDRAPGCWINDGCSDISASALRSLRPFLVTIRQFLETGNGLVEQRSSRVCRLLFVSFGNASCRLVVVESHRPHHGRHQARAFSGGRNFDAADRDGHSMHSGNGVIPPLRGGRQIFIQSGRRIHHRLPHHPLPGRRQWNSPHRFWPSPS